MQPLLAQQSLSFHFRDPGVPYLAEEGGRGETGCPKDSEILEKKFHHQANHITTSAHTRCRRPPARTHHRGKEIARQLAECTIAPVQCVRVGTVHSLYVATTLTSAFNHITYWVLLGAELKQLNLQLSLLGLVRNRENTYVHTSSYYVSDGMPQLYTCHNRWIVQLQLAPF